MGDDKGKEKGTCTQNDERKLTYLSEFLFDDEQLMLGHTERQCL